MKHEEKHPSPFIDETAEIDTQQLSGRKGRVLKHFSIRTVGELLSFDPHPAMRMRAVGETTVKQLLELQRTIASQGTGSLQGILLQASTPSPEHDKVNSVAPDYSEAHTILKSLFLICIPRQRDRQILRRRLGLEAKEGENRPTLETLADEFGLTRERIRQICRDSRASLQRPQSLKTLAPLWEAVDRHLEMHNGVHFIDALFEEIKAEFGWRDSSLQTFAILLDLNRNLSMDSDSGTVSRIDCQCLTCEEVKSCISGIIDAQSEDDKMELSDVGDALLQHCHAHCPNGRKPKTPFQPRYISLLTTGIPSVDVMDGCLVSRYLKLLEQGGNVRELAYEILRKTGRPLHFRKVAEIIRKQSRAESMKSLKDNCVHGTLVRCDTFCCTSRGYYGLSSWNMKQYISHGMAVIRLLQQTGRPMTVREIIDELTRNNEFSAPNIHAALRSHSRIRRLAKGLYTLAE